MRLYLAAEFNDAFTLSAFSPQLVMFSPVMTTSFRGRPKENNGQINNNATNAFFMVKIMTSATHRFADALLHMAVFGRSCQFALSGSGFALFSGFALTLLEEG